MQVDTESAMISRLWVCDFLEDWPSALEIGRFTTHNYIHTNHLIKVPIFPPLPIGSDINAHIYYYGDGKSSRRIANILKDSLSI